MRSKVDPLATGTAIFKMRQRHNGSLLIEINGGPESAKKVRDVMERSLGPGASVRMMENSLPVEIRNLDSETTREEVLEAVAVLGDPNGV